VGFATYDWGLVRTCCVRLAASLSSVQLANWRGMRSYTSGQARQGSCLRKWRRKLMGRTSRRLVVWVLALGLFTFFTDEEATEGSVGRELVLDSFGECLSHDQELVRQYFQSELKKKVDGKSYWGVESQDMATAHALKRCERLLGRIGTKVETASAQWQPDTDGQPQQTVLLDIHGKAEQHDAKRERQHSSLSDNAEGKEMDVTPPSPTLPPQTLQGQKQKTTVSDRLETQRESQQWKQQLREQPQKWQQAQQQKEEQEQQQQQQQEEDEEEEQQQQQPQQQQQQEQEQKEAEKQEQEQEQEQEAEEQQQQGEEEEEQQQQQQQQQKEEEKQEQEQEQGQEQEQEKEAEEQQQQQQQQQQEEEEEEEEEEEQQQQQQQQTDGKANGGGEGGQKQTIEQVQTNCILVRKSTLKISLGDTRIEDAKTNQQLQQGISEEVETALIPKPVSIQVTSATAYKQVVTGSVIELLPGAAARSGMALAAAQTFADQVSKVSPSLLKVCGHQGQIPQCARTSAAARRIHLSCKNEDPAVIPSMLDESYTLVVPAEAAAAILLSAQNAVGLLRGLATLAQLISTAPNSKTILQVPVLEIRDQPTHRWRGLLLDVSRHFIPMHNVIALLPLMTAVKLNVLHIHLTDDQGWRYESKVREPCMLRVCSN
jgi:chemotaxis protein histidine kinase CheA